MKDNNVLTVQPYQVDNAISILTQLKDDPKAQKCLAIYRKLPTDKQDILLVAMDAFVIGAEAAMQLSEQKQA